MKPQSPEDHDKAVAGYDMALCKSILGLSYASYPIAQDRGWLRERMYALKRRMETLSREAQQQNTP